MPGGDYVVEVISKFHSGLWTVGGGIDVPDDACQDIVNFDIDKGGGLVSRKGYQRFKPGSANLPRIGVFAPGWTLNTDVTGRIVTVTVPTGESLQKRSGLAPNAGWAFCPGSFTTGQGYAITSYNETTNAFTLATAVTPLLTINVWSLFYVGRAGYVGRLYHGDPASACTIVQMGRRIDSYEDDGSQHIIVGNLTYGYDINAVQGIKDGINHLYVCNGKDLPLRIDCDLGVAINPGSGSLPAPRNVALLFSSKPGVGVATSVITSDLDINNTRQPSRLYGIAQQTSGLAPYSHSYGQLAVQALGNPVFLATNDTNAPTRYADALKYGYKGEIPWFFSVEDVDFQYNTGSVTTNSTTTVTGNGTLWKTGTLANVLPIAVGDILHIQDITSPGGTHYNELPSHFYYIEAVATDTSLTVDRPLRVTGGPFNYAIYKNRLAAVGTGSYNISGQEFDGAVALGNLSTGTLKFVAPEKVTNGTFSGSAAGWTLGTRWTYSNGKCARDAGDTTDNTPLVQNVSCVIGETYRLSFDATQLFPSSPGQALQVTLGGVQFLTSNWGGGTWVQIITATSTGNLMFQAAYKPLQQNPSVYGYDLSTSIDNISVTRIVLPLTASQGDFVVGFHKGSLANPYTSGGTVQACVSRGAALDSINASGYTVYKVCVTARLYDGHNWINDVGVDYKYRTRIDSMWECQFGGAGAWFPIVGGAEASSLTDATAGYQGVVSYTRAANATSVASTILNSGYKITFAAGTKMSDYGVQAGDPTITPGGAVNYSQDVGWRFLDNTGYEWPVQYIESETIIHIVGPTGHAAPVLTAPQGWSLKFRGDVCPSLTSDQKNRPIRDFADSTLNYVGVPAVGLPGWVYVYSNAGAPATIGQSIKFRPQQDGSGYILPDTGNTPAAKKGNVPYRIGVVSAVNSSDPHTWSLEGHTGLLYGATKFAVIKGRGTDSVNPPKNGRLLFHAKPTFPNDWYETNTYLGNSTIGIKGCCIADIDVENFSAANKYTGQLPSGDGGGGQTGTPVISPTDPPIYKFALWFLGRMWWFNITERDGTTKYPSQARYSEPDNPEATRGDNFYTVGQLSGEGGLQGAFVLNETLYVLKDRGFYSLTGDVPENITIRRIDSEVGCLSWKTVVVGKNVAYWLDKGNVYAFDGASLRSVGDSISNVLEGAADAGVLPYGPGLAPLVYTSLAERKISSAIFRRGRYWLSFGNDPPALGDYPRTLIFDPVTGGWTSYDYGGHSWFDCDTEVDDGELIFLSRFNPAETNALLYGQWIMVTDQLGIASGATRDYDFFTNAVKDIAPFLITRLFPRTGSGAPSESTFEWIDFQVSEELATTLLLDLRAALPVGVGLQLVSLPVDPSATLGNDPENTLSPSTATFNVRVTEPLLTGGQAYPTVAGKRQSVMAVFLGFTWASDHNEYRGRIHQVGMRYASNLY